MKSRLKTLLYGSMAALLLTMADGCAVKKVPPVRTYTLNVETPGIQKIASASPLFQSLGVEVDMQGRLGGTRNLYYLSANHRLQPYAYHRWYDTLATMLENKLLVALKEADVAQNVTDTTQSAEAKLHIQIVQAAIDVTDPAKPVAKVRLLATLQNKTKTETKLFESAVSTHSIDPEKAVDAFNEAVDQIVMEMVKWLESE